MILTLSEMFLIEDVLFVREQQQQQQRIDLTEYFSTYCMARYVRCMRVCLCICSCSGSSADILAAAVDSQDIC